LLICVKPARSARASMRFMRALILSASGFEESELLVPYYRLLEEGLEVDVASPQGGAIAGQHGYPLPSSLALAEVRAEHYDVLVVPGGKAPQALLAHAAALELVRRFGEAGMPLAAICHGPRLLAAAGVLKGRRVTGHASIAGELRRAGARYEDSAAVVDGNLVTSRVPADLPAFMHALLGLLRGGASDAQELAAAAV
jgi:protease I